MRKLIPALLVGFLPLPISCNRTEVEIPKYAKYDWYAHYIIGGSEKDILYLFMTTDIQTTLNKTDSVIWFGYDIITEDKELIALKGKPKEERINTLVSCFTNVQYLYNSKVKTSSNSHIIFSTPQFYC